MMPDEVKGWTIEEAPHQLPQNDIEPYQTLWQLRHAWKSTASVNGGNCDL